MSNPPKEGTSEWDQWCSQDGALQKALCIIWSQTHVPNSPTPAPNAPPKSKPNPAVAAPSITAAPPPPPPPAKPSGNAQVPAGNPRPADSPSKTQNPAYTSGISSSTITSAAVASNTVSANLSTNQTSSIVSAPTTTTTIDVGGGSNTDGQTALNPAAKALKFWIPLIGVVVLVLIVFTIATCLGYQFVRRRKLKKQLQRGTLGSLEKGSTDNELLNHCSSAGEVVSSQTDVSSSSSSSRSSSDNVVLDESPLSADDNNDIFSGKITVDALTSTMYYNGQVVPPIGTRIIPPEDQIKLDTNETQPEGQEEQEEQVRYNSRSLVFPE